MEFSPQNKIVQYCLQGIAMEEAGNAGQARALFLQAWNEAQYDFEKFISAHFLARHQQNISDRLQWLETALKFALKINDDSVKSAFPSLYASIASCYEELSDTESAEKNYALARSSRREPSEKGPFYHGTKADLQPGDTLTAGRTSNYKPGLEMNHIYFTANMGGAGLAAALAAGEGRERVYIVEPTGRFENDPNVTDKKFPGNLTRSYRSQAPLKVVGEALEWSRQSTGQIQNWRTKLANNKGEIIN